MKNAVAIALLLLAASTAAAAGLPKPQKIVIVFEENKSYEDVVKAKSGDPLKLTAPYITSLAAAGASINIAAFHHPSQPNYIEFFFGTNKLTLASGPYTVVSDACFSAPTTTTSILNQLGSKFLGYADGWKPGTPVTTCTLPAPDYFARKHCPWMVATNGLSYTRTIDDFPTEFMGFKILPPLSMVIPNLIHDMHSLPGVQDFNVEGDSNQIPQLVKNGDGWLSQKLALYAQWAMQNNSLLIITWDENSRGKQEGPDQGKGLRPPDNHIATIFYGPMVIPGSNGGNTIYTHYDLQLTVMQLLGLNGVNGGATAKTITGIWK